MQRQKSLLSFFKKSETAGVSQTVECPPLDSLSNATDEVRGTDTPPEKVPRKILPGGYSGRVENFCDHSLFTSIQHKFNKVDFKASNQKRFDLEGNLPQPESVPACNGKDIAFNVDNPSGIESNISGPETPGTTTVVNRYKLARETDENDLSVLECKRAKILRESVSPSRDGKAVSDNNVRFEWLDPLKIRDANKRLPGDPLYDNKTVYIPPDALKKMSASQKQYWGIKSQYMDVVLFFKVGKFYELYELDAEIGHKELDWKMTLSGVGKCRQVGISESGIDDAVEKLVARGYKVGRIEQLATSDQVKAKGTHSVIPRKLIQVVTPSTTNNDRIGPDAVHLLAIKESCNQLDDGKTNYGFAFVDCAALQFWVGSVSDDASCSSLGALLMQVSPREIIYERPGLSKEAVKALKKFSSSGSAAAQVTTVAPDTDFQDPSEVTNMIQLKNYFKSSSKLWNNAFNDLMHKDVALSALGALVHHLSRFMLDDTLRGGDVLPYHVYMGSLRMDGQTLVNLEIFCNNADGGSAGTLYRFLDHCLTSSGKRLLRRWLSHPLKHIDSINNRLNVVEGLVTNPDIPLAIEQHLRKLPDLERMLARLKTSYQATSSLAVPLIGKKILKQRVKVFGSLVKGLRVAMNLLFNLRADDRIYQLLLKLFNLPELDGHTGLHQLLSQLDAAVDSEFPHYQNQDLTEAEAETLSLLIELFMEKFMEWSELTQAISITDVLRSFSVVTSMSCSTMSRPILLPPSKGSSSLETGSLLNIKSLWHPFALKENDGHPVPNDILLGEENGPRSLLLTGPNMGGKSTLLRATCLAVILAQLGCYVPSERCELSVVDIIFTRLGATDRIMTGESTFLVECTETASILQNATQNSLVILDELGRGTSTFDGYAIAYSVFRHLVETINCRLLFATHYHPLTKEFACHPRVSMQHMACAFTSQNRELVFLYRLSSGPCPESYGLQVASLAGVPERVVAAAAGVSRMLEKSMRKSFKSSEQRSEFSTLHEQWLRAVLNIAQVEDPEVSDDVYDNLFCLWHELRSSYRSCKIN